MESEFDTIPRADWVIETSQYCERASLRRESSTAFVDLRKLEVPESRSKTEVRRYDEHSKDVERTSIPCEHQYTVVADLPTSRGSLTGPNSSNEGKGLFSLLEY